MLVSFCYALISGGWKGAAISKFLTYEDRLVIAQLLQENASFGVIGKKLGKDRKCKWLDTTSSQVGMSSVGATCTKAWREDFAL